MATKTVRPKMSVENRAKQFMPFAALKGLPEALAEKEKKVNDEREGKYREHNKNTENNIDILQHIY